MKFDRCFGCMEEIHGYPCPVCGFDPAQAAAPNYVLPYGAILTEFQKCLIELAVQSAGQ